MNFADLSRLVPELLAAAAALAIFLLDLAGAGRRWTGRAGLAFLLAALGAALLAHPRAAGEAPERILSALAIDGFGSFVKMIVLAAGAGAFTLALGGLPLSGRHEGEGHFLVASLVFAATALAGATDLVLIYVLLEFVSLASYLLVALPKDGRAAEGALKYFLVGAASSAAMLFGFSYLYGMTGLTDATEIASILPRVAGEPLFAAGAFLALAGFGFKVALVPFHFWAPDAYEGAPTAVTALLSVGPKAAGFAVFARVFSTLWPGFGAAFPYVATAIGVVTMTLGNTAAILQTDAKRLLAYSSIAQAGYLFIGIAAGRADGYHGLLYYLLAYLFMNLGAFAVVAALERRAGGTGLGIFDGAAARDPWLAGCLVVFLLALAGIPPTSGFVGKYLLFVGAFKAGFLGLALAGVLNSVVSIYYYFGIVRRMYFLPPPEGAAAEPQAGEPAFLHAAAAVSLAATLALGLFPEPANRLTRGALTLLADAPFRLM